MTIESLMNRLSQYFSGLYYRQWEIWELLTIAITALMLLILIVRRQRKGAATKSSENQVRKRSSIIGIKLVDRNQNPPEIKESKKDPSTDTTEKPGKEKKWGKTTEKWEKFHKQIEKHKHEIAEYKQTEMHLKKQVDKLKSTIQELKRKNSELEQTEQLLKKKVLEHTTAGINDQNSLTKSKQNEPSFKPQPTEAPIINKELKLEVAKSKRAKGKFGERTDQAIDSKELKEPLDVHKLKAIAELAKQIQGRPRQR